MRRLAVPLVLLVTSGLPAAAQPRHPIYLQYDGFGRNPGIYMEGILQRVFTTVKTQIYAGP